MNLFSLHTARNGNTASRGFTLIELLVVIAIIGILASIVLASLSTSRKKGRDARRLADLKQIANQIELLDTGRAATSLAGCATASSLVKNCTTPDLSAYSDPSASVAATACDTSVTAACNYTIGKNTLTTAAPNTQNYEVCAYLEVGIGPRTTPGFVSVSSNSAGSVIAGCQ